MLSSHLQRLLNITRDAYWKEQCRWYNQGSSDKFVATLQDATNIQYMQNINGVLADLTFEQNGEAYIVLVSGSHYTMGATRIPNANLRTKLKLLQGKNVKIIDN